MDTNKYQDLQRHLSLNLPDDYIPNVADSKPTNYTISRKNKDTHILVATGYFGVFQDWEEWSTRFLDGLKEQTQGFQLVSRKNVALPGNVPAEIIEATASGGKQAVISVVAIDGPRSVNVIGLAPSDDKEAVEEVRKIVESLRIFEPESAK